MQTLKSIFSEVGKPRDPQIIRVDVSDSGFVVRQDEGISESVDWTEVEFIYTYKVDCYTIDMIWLAFGVAGRHEIHIREETGGFESLMSAMNRAFPNIDQEWYVKVMQPPFAENLTLLYRRQSEAEHPVGPEQPLGDS